MICHSAVPIGHPGDDFLMESSRMSLQLYKIGHATLRIGIDERLLTGARHVVCGCKITAIPDAKAFWTSHSLTNSSSPLIAMNPIWSGVHSCCA